MRISIFWKKTNKQAKKPKGLVHIYAHSTPYGDWNKPTQVDHVRTHQAEPFHFPFVCIIFPPAPTKNNKRCCKAEQIYRSPSHWPSHISFHSEPLDRISCRERTQGGNGNPVVIGLIASQVMGHRIKLVRHLHRWANRSVAGSFISF